MKAKLLRKQIFASTLALTLAFSLTPCVNIPVGVARVEAASSISSSLTHNFSSNGLSSNYFTISGNLSSSKGTVYYDGLTLNTCLKMESSTNVSFSTSTTSNLTLVFNSDFTKRVNIDGKDYTANGGIVSLQLNSGSHTIKKTDSANLYYIKVQMNNTSNSDTTVVAPSTSLTKITSQKFADGWYYIKNVKAQKYLQATGASNAANVIISTGTGVDGQKWYLANEGSGVFTLKNKLGYSLDVAYGSADDNINVQVYSTHSGIAQKFMLGTYGSNNQYAILTHCSGDIKCLDAERAKTADGTNIIQYTAKGSENQLWVLESCGSQSGSTTPTNPTPSNPTPSNPTPSTPTPSVTSGDIYVSASGSSSASGSQSSPMNLETAITKIQAGKTIWMLPGTYYLSKTIMINESNAGKSGAYKAIKPLNGKVVLDFSRQSLADSNRGIVLDGSYWHLYDITIKGAGDNGMLLSGDHNLIEKCVFTANRDTGLQISRYNTNYSNISQWPSYNTIKNCTSFNNCDSSGENADGFAAKLTCGNGNVFDGCMSYNNSDDGWDLYAKSATGPIGVVTLKNCIAFRNGKLTNGSGTATGDMNGFKLGGSGVGTPHIVENCIAFENGAHGFTDNNNPTGITLKNCTSFNNSKYSGSQKSNFAMTREKGGINTNLISFSTNTIGSDAFIGKVTNTVYFNSAGKYYKVSGTTTFNGKEKLGSAVSISGSDFNSISAPGTSTDFHTYWRNSDGSINTKGFLQVKSSSQFNSMGAKF